MPDVARFDSQVSRAKAGTAGDVAQVAAIALTGCVKLVGTHYPCEASEGCECR